MAEISDAYMQEQLGRTREYAVVLLQASDQYGREGSDAVIWEHGRRNFALRADGRLAIVCPVRDGSGVDGIGIFNLDAEQTRAVMDDDPGVSAGIFVYDIHRCRSFPGDSLPA